MKKKFLKKTLFEQATTPIFISTPPPKPPIFRISCSSGHRDSILVSKVAEYQSLYPTFSHTTILKCLLN